MVHGAKQLLFLPLPKALADSGPWAASLLSFGQVSMGFKVDVAETLGNTMSWGTYVSMTTRWVGIVVAKISGEGRCVMMYCSI